VDVNVDLEVGGGLVEGGRRPDHERLRVVLAANARGIPRSEKKPLKDTQVWIKTTKRRLPLKIPKSSAINNNRRTVIVDSNTAFHSKIPLTRYSLAHWGARSEGENGGETSRVNMQKLGENSHKAKLTEYMQRHCRYVCGIWQRLQSLSDRRR